MTQKDRRDSSGKAEVQTTVPEENTVEEKEVEAKPGAC